MAEKTDPKTTPTPDPVPVVITEEQQPIPVVVEAVKIQPLATVTKGEGTTLTPTTTEQEDVVTAGQRRVNLIWEFTQAAIAIVVVVANMFAAVYNVLQNRAVDVPMILSSSLFLIIGFYFSRTNHTQIGGIGQKPRDRYDGR